MTIELQMAMLSEEQLKNCQADANSLLDFSLLQPDFYIDYDCNSEELYRILVTIEAGMLAHAVDAAISLDCIYDVVEQPKYNESENVHEIANLLANISEELFLKFLPNTVDEFNKKFGTFVSQLPASIASDYMRLRKFYKTAAAANLAVVTWWD